MTNNIITCYWCQLSSIHMILPPEVQSKLIIIKFCVLKKSDFILWELGSRADDLFFYSVVSISPWLTILNGSKVSYKWYLLKVCWRLRKIMLTGHIRYIQQPLNGPTDLLFCTMSQIQHATHQLQYSTQNIKKWLQFYFMSPSPELGTWRTTSEVNIGLLDISFRVGSLIKPLSYIKLQTFSFNVHAGCNPVWKKHELQIVKNIISIYYYTDFCLCSLMKLLTVHFVQHCICNGVFNSSHFLLDMKAVRVIKLPIK
jgi:hypothetical protein